MIFQLPSGHPSSVPTCGANRKLCTIHVESNLWSGPKFIRMRRKGQIKHGLNTTPQLNILQQITQAHTIYGTGIFYLHLPYKSTKCRKNNTMHGTYGQRNGESDQEKRVWHIFLEHITWWSVNFNGSWHKASKIAMCKRRHGPVMVVSGGPSLVQWESTPQVTRQMSVTNKTQIVVIPLKRFLSMVQKSQTTTWDEKKTCKLLDKLTFPQLVIAGFLPSPRIHVWHICLHLAVFYGKCR